MVFLNQYSYLTFLLASPFSLPTQWLGMLFLTYLSGTVASSLSGAPPLGRAALLLVGIALMALGSALLLGGSLGAILSGLLISSFGFSLPTPAPAPGSASTWSTTGRSPRRSIWWVTIWEPVWGLYLHPFWEQGARGLVLGIELVLVITAGLSLWLGHLKDAPPAPASAIPDAISAMKRGRSSGPVSSSLVVVAGRHRHHGAAHQLFFNHLGQGAQMKFDLPRGQHHRHVRIALITQVAGFEGHFGMGRQQGLQRRYHQFDMFQPSLVATTGLGAASSMQGTMPSAWSTG